MEEEKLSPSSLKAKIMSSLCCFSGPHHHHQHRNNHNAPEALDLSTAGSNGRSQLLRSSSSTLLWRKSTRSHDVPEIRDRCRSLISRFSHSHHGHGHARSRRHKSHDFSYDPLNYSLNFDDGGSEEELDGEGPIRNFSSRLPSSPSPEKRVAPPSTAVPCS